MKKINFQKLICIHHHFLFPYKNYNFYPRCFHLIPMDAQWMLKGCSMVASATMNTLSKLLSLNF